MQARTYTVEDYLAIEAESDIKHEFWFGQIRAMAGAEPAHNQISGNLVTQLNVRLQARGCRVLTSDQRVRLPYGNYVYPDITVVCEHPIYTEERPRSLINPVLLIEVTSASTGDHDRGAKMHAYTQIESLSEYWIVEQTEAFITRVVRQGPDWTLHFIHDLDDVLRSSSFDIEIPMREIYALVEF